MFFDPAVVGDFAGACLFHRHAHGVRHDLFLLLGHVVANLDFLGPLLRPADGDIVLVGHVVWLRPHHGVLDLAFSILGDQTLHTRSHGPQQSQP